MIVDSVLLVYLFKSNSTFKSVSGILGSVSGYLVIWVEQIWCLLRFMPGVCLVIAHITGNLNKYSACLTFLVQECLLSQECDIDIYLEKPVCSVL